MKAKETFYLTDNRNDLTELTELVDTTSSHQSKLSNNTRPHLTLKEIRKVYEKRSAKEKEPSGNT